MVTTLRIRRPDDWHLHLRDGAALRAVLAHTVARFGRAIVMPNLKPPVTTTAQALAYQERILAALPPGASFTPLMTLYLTDQTTPEEIQRAHDSGAVYGVKLYPQGATTHSECGVTGLERVQGVLEALARIGMPLQIHGEVTDPTADIFDRERLFIDQTLAPLVQRLPELRIVFEHITTREAVDFVLNAGPRVAATLTPQHLLLNRNAILAGGIHPHHYCLPVLKRESHRQALVHAAISGNPQFFLGTDSAPHARHAKEQACGCAGIYSAHAAIELYAECFAAHQALDRLEGFASDFGADFYGLPRNPDHITLIQESWPVPQTYDFGEDAILVPLRAGEKIHWRIDTSV